MNGPEILSSLKEQLAGLVSDALPAIKQPPKLAVSPWIAMSLLQKAIRRGETRLALSAASTLLEAAPDRLWRRIGGIALEDVGLADVETISMAVAALAGKRSRQKMYGDWPVAEMLVRRMCAAQKCRAADDLLMVAEKHPAYERDRLELTYLPTLELCRVATGRGDLVRRAIAAWYAVGTGYRCSPFLRPRNGSPSGFFDHLCEVGIPDSLVEVCREGHRKNGEMLGPLLCLLAAEQEKPGLQTVDDDLPAEVLCSGVPGWALDVYSHEGKAVLRSFLNSPAESARWVREHLPPAARPSFLGGIIFRVEGGLMRRRVQWDRSITLRAMMDVEANLKCADASEALILARKDISVLNEHRAAAYLQAAHTGTCYIPDDKK